MTPQEIVVELDKHIVGQQQAKRAVAIALRNRWRRQQVEPGLRADLVQVRVVDMPNGLRHGVVRAVWREGQRVL